MRQHIFIAAYILIAVAMLRRFMEKVLRPATSGIFRLKPAKRYMAVQLSDTDYLLVATCRPDVTLEHRSRFTDQLAPYLGISSYSLVTYPSAMWRGIDNGKNQVRKLSEVQARFSRESTICEAYRKGCELARMKEYDGIRMV